MARKPRLPHRWVLAIACAACAGRAHVRYGGAAEQPRTTAAGVDASGVRLSLDRGWRFHLGDVPSPKITGQDASYRNAKAGVAWGAAAPDFDDSSWREVDLPHDWVVEGPFDPNENAAQGYRPRGIAWYRRTLKLDPAVRGRHLELDLEGIATHATVWFNGSVVARSFSGYTASYIDVTPYARYGEDTNSIAVRVDADAMEGWWYEGGGIYRHTWLVERDPVHVVTDGVYALPRLAGDGTWVLPVETTVANTGRGPADVDVEATLVDPSGHEVASSTARVRADPFAEAVARVSIPVTAPHLWSIDDPALYRVRSAVRKDGTLVDVTTTTTGFRTFRFDPNLGFFLNERPIKIQGVCNHQDHAGVGVAVPDALWDFRLRRLKAIGANALRCSHNAPAPEFLDAADRLGMLVMDENRNFDVSPEGLRELGWLVRRDRNHPSVILWSVFNEEPMQGTPEGYEMVRRMSAVVKSLDTTRPVTAAMNDGMFQPVNVSQAVDVVGFNYQNTQYDRFHAAHPTLPMMSSEDTSAFMTRGEYATDRSRNVMGSYDDEAAPWGATQRAAWKAIADRPFMAGGFAWTGFDYRGEPTPFRWPSVSSFFGILDACGFAKTASYLRRAAWIHDRPVLAVVPHWTWPGWEGRPIRVMAISNADSVALTLNGKAISEQPVGADRTATWQVPYAPGRIEVVAKAAGREVAREAIETAGTPAKIELSPDRPALDGDGWDAEPIEVRAVDAAGRVVPNANMQVDFEVSQGRFLGAGNGDPNSHEADKEPRRHLFHGLAQLIVQTVAGAGGPLSVRATSAGLVPGRIDIAVRRAEARPSLPPAPPRRSTPSTP
ncbi:MAG TPA: beta-galactosidase GalA [Polyangiaceae bacterium]|jgi:beta-galactosidase